MVSFWRDVKIIDNTSNKSSCLLKKCVYQALSFFDAERHEWVAEPGEFKAIVAASSDDVRGEVSL